MLKAALSALLSHWRRHPVQLAMLLLGLGLATALWSAVQAINGEARASYARAAALLGQDRLARLVPADGGLMDQQLFVSLRRAGWLLSPVLEGETRLGGERVRLIGIDPVSLPPLARAAGLPEGGEGLARFFAPPWQFITHPDTAERLAGLSTTPVIASDGLLPGTVLTDIGHAQHLLGLDGKLSHLMLWPDQPEGLSALDKLAPGLVHRAPSASGDIGRLTGSFHLNLTAFGFLSFAVGLFIVHAAVGLAFEQRRGSLRTLRALGVPVAALIGLMALEALLLAIVAGLAGVALGYLIATALLPDVALTLKGLYGADVPGSLTLRPAVWAAGLAIAVIGALGSQAVCFWQVWRQPLLAVARPEAWGRASARSLAVQAVSGGVLLTACLPAARVIGGLAGGFALLALLLLGAALMLPVMLAFALRAGERLSRPGLAQWFWADARQQLPGLSLALMALLLALSANIGVGTMVASFRQTFTGWLDQRLASELYVTARTEDEAVRLVSYLETRADAVLPIWHVEGAAAGQPAEIYGVADHATYRDHWPLIAGTADVWDRVARGEGLLANEQLWRRAKLELGQPLRLPGGLALPLVGVYSDYGNPIGQVIVGLDVLTRHYPQVERLRFGVRVAPEKAQSLLEALRDDFGLPRDNVISQAGIKAFSLQVFERTFTVTAALNLLTLGVAAIAMFASLLTLAGMRLPLVAPVWAMGVRLPHIALLDLGRSLMLAALTLLAAVPLGLLLAWVLLAVVNVEAFGWRLPLHLFPADWLHLGLMALAAALVASAWPAWVLARTQPASLAKVFAHER